MNIKEIKDIAMRLFGERTTFMSLLQEIAENFYPERADFTYRRSFGQEYADNLFSSYPTMIRRDLGNQLGSMLRPSSQEWFRMRIREEETDTEGSRYLEWLAKQMRRAMYDRHSMFTRATKEGDHDFAGFGQCVISVSPSPTYDHLLYRNWHLRDCAWEENDIGGIGFFARKWKTNTRNLVRMFGNKVDEKVSNKSAKEPFEEIECLHIVCEADYYSQKSDGKPYWSIYYDLTNDVPIEEVAVWEMEYVIPRWQTVSGSQYAFSPATIIALPDARMIQSVALTLMEAGEKATNPPLVGTSDVVKSDVAVYAGGLTWVDKEYDERLGDALRPLNQDFRGLPYGFEIQADVRMQLKSAFYLDRLTLPVNAPEMTAYEVGQRVQEYIREAMPIFEPMENEYNGQLCELTFNQMARMNAFGDMRAMPKNLQGKDIQFEFESPLHDAIEQQKGQQFLEAKALIAEAASIDGTTIGALDAKKAIRDALLGIGVSAEWVRSEQELEAFDQQRQQQAASEQRLDEMEQSSQVAANLAKAQEGMVA